MWLKKSVHFEQHYLSKWKTIQPRALQLNLSLFLQLLKTIPEVNSNLCRCILIFCRAEKLSWPYFSTCKTNFLWQKSEFTAGSLQCFARSQTSQLLWGKENELIWDEDQSLFKLSGAPYGPFHWWIWMCKGGLESLGHLWWLRAGCQADLVSCVPASGIPHRSGNLGFLHKLKVQKVKVSLSGSLPSPAAFPAVQSLLLIPALQRVIRAGHTQPASPLSAILLASLPLWHSHLPWSIPTFSALPVLPMFRVPQQWKWTYHALAKGLLLFF